MAWYYVKNGGTATGDGGRVTTQRTGLWSATTSEYYDTLEDCIAATTEPGDTDLILISDLSSNSYAIIADLILNQPGDQDGLGMMIVSVDNANQEDYKPGADETVTGAFSINFEHNVLIAGVDLTAGQGIQFETNGRFIRFSDLTISAIGANNVINTLGSDGVTLDLINVDINRSNALSGINISNGVLLRWYGGTLTGEATATVSAFVGYADAGATVLLMGVDLSVLTGDLVNSANVSDSDAIDFKLIHCKLNSSVGLLSDTGYKLPHQKFEMRGCDDSIGSDLFRFHFQTGSGKAVNNDAIFVDNDVVWSETSKKSSIEITTTAVCGHPLPFIFDLPLGNSYINLADASSDVLRIPITTTLTLTDVDIAAYLMYPDGTTSVQANWVTSGKTVGSGNFGTDPFSAGSTLPTSTTGWTGAKTNKYHLELDTTGDAGQVQAIGVRIEVYKPSIVANTVFFGTELELS